MSLSMKENFIIELGAQPMELKVLNHVVQEGIISAARTKILDGWIEES